MPSGAVARCAVAALLFGATTPLAAELAGDLGAFRLAGLLYLGAALAAAPWVLGARRRDRPVAADAAADAADAGVPGAGWRAALVPVAVAVVVGGAVGPALLAAGLARTPSATAALLLNLELVATTALAATVFREHVGRRVAAGTALVAVAGAALAWSGRPEPRLGALLVAAACLCWAVDNCVTAVLDGVTPEQVTLAKGLVAGGANLAVGVLAAGLPGPGRAAAALAVGAVGYGLSITLWVGGARDLGAARAQLVFASAPFLGAAVAWTAFAQPVTGRQLAAGALAAVGVALVAGSGHEHEHRHVPVDHGHAHTHDDGHHDHVHVPGGPGDGLLAPVGAGRHDHPHRHGPRVHAHPHVPDLHHRHDH
jgi:drug/metabolite transporter (DMT)-like permease